MPTKGNPLKDTDNSEVQRQRWLKRKKRKLNTPQVRRDEVVARHLAGQSTSRITREMSMSPTTVLKILSQPEVRELKESYRQKILGQIPIVIERVRGKLRSPRVDWRLLTELLHGTQVLVNRVEEQVSTKDEFSDRTTADLQYYVIHGRFPDDEKAPDSAGQGEKSTPRTPGPGTLVQ